MNDPIKILLVEDDKNLRFVTSDNLNQEGFQTTLAEDGEAGLDQFLAAEFDICILDVMMPKKDGFELARDIRKVNKQVPIIFLTAKVMDEDKIKGLTIGADDYITKPFNINELVLRVKNIVKRSRDNSELSKTLFNIGVFNFDYKNLLLKGPVEDQKLTKKEAELLRILYIHRNEIISRERILKTIWGEDDYFLGRSMDVFITKLRKYLKEDSSIAIENIHGVGFKLTA